MELISSRASNTSTDLSIAAGCRRECKHNTSALRLHREYSEIMAVPVSMDAPAELLEQQ